VLARYTGSVEKVGAVDETDVIEYLVSDVVTITRPKLKGIPRRTGLTRRCRSR